METLSEKEQINKERVVNLMLLCFALVGTPVVGVSIVRAVETGMNPSYWAQLSTAIVLCILASIHKKLPYFFKVLVLVATPWILGVISIFTFGLIDGSVMLLFASAICGAALGGIRLGMLSTLAGACATAIIGFLAVDTDLVFNVDTENYMYQASSWVIFVCAFTALSGISVFILGKTSEVAYQALSDLEKEKHKLLETNETRDKLFRVIAHDLRSPFQGLIGGLELLADQNLEAFDEAKRKKLFESMLRDSNATFSMLENLLYWSRSQTGELNVDLKFVDLHTLVSNSVRSCQRQADQKQIHLEVEVPIGIYAFCDERSVQIILANLLNNAIKFTESNGRILLKVKINTDETVSVIVKDSGVGIAEGDRTKLFDNKQYFSTRGTRNESGTGLGLGISFELARLNKATLYHEDNDWEGSSFVLRLPIKHEA